MKYIIILIAVFIVGCNDPVSPQQSIQQVEMVSRDGNEIRYIYPYHLITAKGEATASIVLESLPSFKEIEIFVEYWDNNGTLVTECVCDMDLAIEFRKTEQEFKRIVISPELITLKIKNIIVVLTV